MIDTEILDFLKSNVVATICCVDSDSPWCFNCFYALKESEGILIFKSTSVSKHSALLEHNHKIAGSVLPTNINFAKLQGIQFEGVVLSCNKYFLQEATEIYHIKFPIGEDIAGKIWAIELNMLKFTDNAQGFGYKKIWNRIEITSNI